MRALELRLYPDELIVDLFAGGGGASVGIEWALGRSPDVAINHDREAISMHRVNHPDTKHYIENVWRADPREACRGRRPALAWFSPDCKHFSRAKGGKPVDKNIRGLAWLVILRVCTDGARNACSKLYGSCCRAAQAMGYLLAITYTLASEGGASLRASGFRPASEVKDRQWDCASRPREERDLVGDKVRWERRL